MTRIIYNGRPAQIEDFERGRGRTSRAIKRAGKRALLVVSGGEAAGRHAVELARGLDRTDVRVVSAEYLERDGRMLYGQRFSEIVIDHGVELDPRAAEILKSIAR